MIAWTGNKRQQRVQIAGIEGIPETLQTDPFAYSEQEQSPNNYGSYVICIG